MLHRVINCKNLVRQNIYMIIHLQTRAKILGHGLSATVTLSYSVRTAAPCVGRSEANPHMRHFL